jgi:hypothetical protein
MDYQLAKDTVMADAFGDDSLVVMARMGDEPPRDRMDALVKSLRVICDNAGAQPIIDRDLAYALFGLSTYLPAELDGWSRRGAVFRPTLLGDEIPRLIMAMESIYLGEWIRFDANG